MGRSYTHDIQAAIIANYASHGLQCVGERHLGESRNFEFSEFSEETIGDMIEAVAAEKPDAITIMCTNMRGARIASRYEEKLGIPIYDSTSSAVWAGLKITGKDASQIKGWGGMFEI
jgi:maleate isomerase